MLHALNTTLGTAMPDTSLDPLILAIIRQAMEDWEVSNEVLRHRMYDKKHRAMLKEVRAFFDSDWFTVLTGMKGEDFLRKAYPTKKKEEGTE